MEDYVKEGLVMRKAPLLIYGEIERMLQTKSLTQEERKELERQLAKAKELADRTSDVFGRFNIVKDKKKILYYVDTDECEES